MIKRKNILCHNSAPPIIVIWMIGELILLMQTLIFCLLTALFMSVN